LRRLFSLSFSHIVSVQIVDIFFGVKGLTRKSIDYALFIQTWSHQTTDIFFDFNLLVIVYSKLESTEIKINCTQKVAVSVVESFSNVNRFMKINRGTDFNSSNQF